MKHLPLDALGIQTMASGHLCLCLSERVAWEEFPRYAEVLLKTLDGSKENAVESVETRIWEVSFGGCRLLLVQDDFPMMVSFESPDKDGDALIPQLHAALLTARDA
jgi:hypothetical protein